MISVCLTLFAACMVWAALNDLVAMKIPNLCVLALLAAFVAIVPASDLGWAALASHVAIAFAVLAMCFVLFLVGALGAGDGKLVAVSSLWLGAGTVPFVLMFAVFGGFLAVVVLMFRALPLPAAVAGLPVARQLRSKERAIPYGVAIAPAAVLALANSVWAGHVPFAPLV